MEEKIWRTSDKENAFGIKLQVWLKYPYLSLPEWWAH